MGVGDAPGGVRLLGSPGVLESVAVGQGLQVTLPVAPPPRAVHVLELSGLGA
jgi:hypothetical protein